MAEGWMRSSYVINEKPRRGSYGISEGVMRSSNVIHEKTTRTSYFMANGVEEEFIRHG